MAMIDYGAIAWKNGKLISTDVFTPMEDMVGWDDSDLDLEHPLVDDYFAYIGDKDFTLAFYKSVMRMYNSNYSYDSDTIFLVANHLKVGRGGDFGQGLTTKMLR